MWRADRLLFSGVGARSVLSGVATATTLLILKGVIDGMAVPPGRGRVEVGPLLAFGAVAVGAAVTAQLVAMLRRILAEKTIQAYNAEVLARTGGVELSRFDAADFYDDMRRVMANGVHTPLSVTTTIFDAAAQLVPAFGIGAVVAWIQPWVLPVVLLDAAVMLVTQRGLGSELYRFLLLP